MDPHRLERRGFLKLGVMSTFGLIATASDLFWQVQRVHAAELPSSSLSPETALEKLLAGNERFVQQKLEHPDQSFSRVKEVASAQHPFATILSCADSRVTAEIIFDQGLGDLFDVRIAGNIATPEAIGSIEYAVALLGSPLLMVLGHERCGAVTAAVKNEVLPGEIGTFIKPIQPAVAKTRSQPGDPVDNAVIANVQYQVERLQQSPLLMAQVEAGKLKIVGGRYDLDSGKVMMLPV